MSIEVWDFDVTVPAGTAKASPQTTSLGMPVGRRVDRITWRVPPGPRGLMGWQLSSKGTPFIPRNLGGWIATDDESATWELEDQLEADAWEVIAYNSGGYAHTVYFTFLLSLVAAGGPSTSQPLDMALLSSGGGQLL